MDALADLATDELTELTGMDAERASKLIMTARAPWFEEPLLPPPRRRSSTDAHGERRDNAR